MNIEDSREFIQATPGPVGIAGPYPGEQMESGKWKIYWPPPYRQLSMEQIETMKRKFKVSDLWPGNWKGRVKTTILKKDAVPQNSDPITLIKWWPKDKSWDEDDILAVIEVDGDYGWPEEAFLGLGLSEAKKVSNTRRVAIRSREKKEGLTVGRSLGGGGGMATVYDSSRSGAAFAGGAILGTNRTRAEDSVQFEIVCLNDGPKEEPVAEELIAEELIVEEPVVEELIVEEPVVEKSIALLPLTVYFDFDEYSLKEEYLSEIKKYAEWLAEEGEDFRIQVEGHACNVGSADYNSALARKRAQEVYNSLVAHGEGMEKKVEQFVSLGEDRQVSEYQPENRRVILRVIGVSSGK